MLQIKAAGLDRSSEEEIRAFNGIMEDYRKSLFNEVPEVPKDKTGKTLKLNEIMDKKKSLLKPINVKMSKKTGEFELTNLKDLLNGGTSIKV